MNNRIDQYLINKKQINTNSSARLLSPAPRINPYVFNRTSGQSSTSSNQLQSPYQRTPAQTNSRIYGSTANQQHVGIKPDDYFDPRPQHNRLNLYQQSETVHKSNRNLYNESPRQYIFSPQTPSVPRGYQTESKFNMNIETPLNQFNMQGLHIEEAKQFPSPVLLHPKSENTSSVGLPIAYRSTMENNKSVFNSNDNDENNVTNKHRKSTIVTTATLLNAVNLSNKYADLDALYEIFGSCVNIRAGKYWCEKLILLRDYAGPVIKVTFFEIDLTLEEDIMPGDSLRVVGRMLSHNHLKAIKIRKAKADEMQAISRLYGVSLFNIKKNI